MLRLKERNGIYHMHGAVRCKDGTSVYVRRSTGFPVSRKFEATDFMYAEMQTIQRLGQRYSCKTERQPDESVAAAVATYFRKPSTVGPTDSVTLDRLRVAHGKRVLSGMTLRELSDFAHAGGVAANTVARRMNTLNAFLNYCEARGFSVPAFRLKRPAYDDRRVRWLSAHERNFLLSKMSGRVKDLAAFMFHTGCRQGEAYDLRWRDIHGTQVSFSSRKGRGSRVRTRSVPLNETALQAIGPRGDDGQLVFCLDSGLKFNRTVVGRAFRSACEAAKFEDFRVHDTRHTFASLLAQHGVTLREIADMLGHTSLDMVARYAHLCPSKYYRAVSTLDEGEV